MNSQSIPTEATAIKPPLSSYGILGWLRSNLFNSPVNSIISLVLFAFFVHFAPIFCKWAFVHAVWDGSSEICKQSSGACWPVITKNIRFILFGFYPVEEQWRQILAIMLLFLLAGASYFRKLWSKTLLYAWVAGVAIMAVLMRGGIFGLATVESTKWSGISLTILLSLFGLSFAYPLGVLLALGRKSSLPAIKSLCVIYIEVIRGVPLISMLFMSSVMFPLFLPEGITIDKIVRAQAAIILFTAAYIAEVVRGGLQAIPKGQYEAAEALGLDYGKKMRLIILPQALKIVIPPTVSILISAFKDTSLVIIIGLFDLMKTTKVTLSNPEWMGFSTEAYIFIAILYFFGCFSMSQFSRRLEFYLKT